MSNDYGVITTPAAAQKFGAFHMHHNAMQQSKSQASAGWHTSSSGAIGLALSPPLNIKAAVLDLDGTLMPTYKVLLSIVEADSAFRNLFDSIYHKNYGNTLPAQLMSFFGIQSLLHQPEQSTQRMFVHILRLLECEIPEATLDNMQRVACESFRAFDGVIDFLKIAKRSDVYLALYTNSLRDFAIERLLRAGISPNYFNAIYAKQDNAQAESQKSIEGPRPVNRDYDRILVPYTFQKPDPTPLKEVANATDATPDEILMIGEGLGDLRAAFGIDPATPRAISFTRRTSIFCFHEEGALNISDQERQMNIRLRPEREALGAESVNREIAELGVEDYIVRLPEGFRTLIDLIEAEKITLSPNRNKTAL